MKRLGVFGACWRGIAIACTLLLATPSTAFADASTGMSYRGPQSVPGVGLTYVCEQSTIADVADNRAWTRTAVADGDFGCTPGQTVNSGYLGVQASGFRNGGYCGTTGYYYSNLATYQWAVGAVLCSNPAGSQAFHTVANAKVWAGTSYYNWGPLASPTQNY